MNKEAILAISYNKLQSNLKANEGYKVQNIVAATQVNHPKKNSDCKYGPGCILENH